jgi:hypothetical protein
MRLLRSLVAKSFVFAMVAVAYSNALAVAQDCNSENCGQTHVHYGHFGHGFGLHSFGGIPHGPLPGQSTQSLNATSGAGDLFHNYYTQGSSNQATAQMYLTPRPVPAWVGHTYYTYQPFYPHHYMYWHKDTYHTYYDNSRGLNRTSAHYYAPPVRTATHSIINKIKIAR